MIRLHALKRGGICGRAPRRWLVRMLRLICVILSDRTVSSNPTDQSDFNVLTDWHYEFSKYHFYSLKVRAGSAPDL